MLPIARTDYSGDDSSTAPLPGPAEFPPTQWSVVAQAAHGTGDEGKQALEHLCDRYWFPLYAFARRSGCTPEDAEDMTQGYLYELLKRKGFQSVDAEKGRLRSFLLTGLRNHMVSEHRKTMTLKRGEGRVLVGLTIEKAERLLAEDSAYGNESPSETFDRRWALALLDRVLSRLRKEYQKKGNGELFELLEPSLTGSEQGDDAYSEIGRKVGLSRSHVGVRVYRMRKRYRKLLWQEIIATVPEDQADSEIRHLFSVFRH